MKKIININLSGRVIPIEDSAYENLQAYIESLRKYFINEEGRDEIINDIEGRIAELMSEKVRKGASTITDADVEEIAASMGRPQDFEAEAAEEIRSSASAASAASSQSSSSANTQSSQTYTKTTTGRGRLYRDTSDKFIGGVCSGIANYMNVDPAIVRILFAIVTFGGFGIGFLLYIILWMILPTKDLDEYSGKRLFRNPEDKVIGGVAGGLSAYFNIDTWKIRLAFAAPLILSIFFSIIERPFNNGIGMNILSGSLTGTFILAYIVLWAVLPQAKSPYDKMEMRGEKVDVNSIKQNVQEGMGNVKDRVKEWSGEVKEAAQNMSNKAKEFSSTRGKAFAADVREASRPVRSGLGHAIGVLFKAFFLFIAGTIAFALFVSLMAVIFGGVAWWPVNNFLWTSKWQQIYAWGTLILFLGVPLVGFLLWLIRRIIGVRSRKSYLGWTFGALWALGWVCASLLAASISKDLREFEAAPQIEIAMPQQPANNKLIVAVTAPKLELSDGVWWADTDWEGWDLSSDSLKLSLIRFHEVQKSYDQNYHVIVRKSSAGRSTGDAINRASKIVYNASYNNSVLDLGSGFAVDKDSKYRGQMIEVEIYVPAGKQIRFDESMFDKLNPISIKIKNRRGWRTWQRTGNDYGWETHGFPWRSNIDYTMGEDGNLKSADGKKVDYDGYRYEQKSDSVLLEEQKQKAADEQRRLKEMEDKLKGKNKKDSTRAEAEGDEDDEEAGSAGRTFPMLSLERMFS
jgi:phage shock protein PspC (stress-responsive transcriptional regulator)